MTKPPPIGVLICAACGRELASVNKPHSKGCEEMEQTKIRYVRKTALAPDLMCADCRTLIGLGDVYYLAWPGPQIVCAECKREDDEAQEPSDAA